MAPQRMIMKKGIPVSAGIARGTAYVIREESHVAVPTRRISEAEVRRGTR